MGIEKFDDNKILIDTDDKLLDDIPFKNVTLMACVIKEDDKYPNYSRRTIMC